LYEINKIGIHVHNRSVCTKALEKIQDSCIIFKKCDPKRTQTDKCKLCLEKGDNIFDYCTAKTTTADFNGTEW